MTGQYAYYEEQLMQSAYALADSPGSRACVQPTANSSLRMGSAGYWYVDQERGQDWMARGEFSRRVYCGGRVTREGISGGQAAGKHCGLGGHPPDCERSRELVQHGLELWEHSPHLESIRCRNSARSLDAWSSIGTNGYAADYPFCLGNTSSPCPSAPFANAPQDGNSNFQNAYSAVIIG